jgi:hypothetical protein
MLQGGQDLLLLVRTYAAGFERSFRFSRLASTCFFISHGVSPNSLIFLQKKHVSRGNGRISAPRQDHRHWKWPHNQPPVTEATRSGAIVGQVIFCDAEFTLTRMGKRDTPRRHGTSNQTTHGRTYITTMAPTSTTINQSSINQSFGARKTFCGVLFPLSSN